MDRYVRFTVVKVQYGVYSRIGIYGRWEFCSLTCKSSMLDPAVACKDCNIWSVKCMKKIQEAVAL